MSEETELKPFLGVFNNDTTLKEIYAGMREMGAASVHVTGQDDNEETVSISLFAIGKRAKKVFDFIRELEDEDE